MNKSIKARLKGIPVLGELLVAIKRQFSIQPSINDSQAYWETRYAKGGTSGSGSYHRLAEFKAQTLNAFLADNLISSAIEFGCGDGHQLSLINYKKYIGFDVSRSAIQLCAARYKTDQSKSFFLYDSQSYFDNHKVFQAELSLSLDVIYHILEDPIFEKYMAHLMGASTKYVIIYSSDFDSKQHLHERHRNFSKWLTENYPEWELIQKVDNPFSYSKTNEENTSSADFFIYQRKS